MEKLLLVNEKDEVLGEETREKCHQGNGILHRAFSVYVFNNKEELLIQRRSRFKKLWPLFWTNSCCSHPRKGESYEAAGERRLKEELGFVCPLSVLTKFQYRANYQNIGSENEICAVLIGNYDGAINPDPKEVADWKMISLEELKEDIIRNPEKYTPWSKIGLEKISQLKNNE